MTTLGSVPAETAAGGVGRLLSVLSLSSIGGGGVSGLSNNVGHHINVTRTVLGSPRVLIVSRPATKLSPKRHIHLQGFVSRFSRSQVILVSARVMSSVRCVSAHGTVVGTKRVISIKAATRLIGQVRNGI